MSMSLYGLKDFSSSEEETLQVCTVLFCNALIHSTVILNFVHSYIILTLFLVALFTFFFCHFNCLCVCLAD